MDSRGKCHIRWNAKTYKEEEGGGGLRREKPAPAGCGLGEAATVAGRWREGKGGGAGAVCEEDPHVKGAHGPGNFDDVRLFSGRRKKLLGLNSGGKFLDC